MSVYMIIEVKINNNELYSQYVEEVSGIVKKFGGKYLVRGGKVNSLSGNWNPERVVEGFKE